MFEVDQYQYFGTFASLEMSRIRPHVLKRLMYLRRKLANSNELLGNPIDIDIDLIPETNEEAEEEIKVLYEAICDNYMILDDTYQNLAQFQQQEKQIDLKATRFQRNLQQPHQQFLAQQQFEPEYHGEDEDGDGDQSDPSDQDLSGQGKNLLLKKLIKIVSNSSLEANGAKALSK